MKPDAPGRSVRLSPDEVPPELADNPLAKFLQTMTPQEEEVLEHLAELDRLEQRRDEECSPSEPPPADPPAAHP
jgi:hypothetical protein